MVDAPKARLSRLRKHLVIPRELYLAAVERQEARAWAKWTDPTWFNEMRPKFQLIRKKYGITTDEPPAREPDPALFDTVEDIRRDDGIIDAYLVDNPKEYQMPMARGTTHDELLVFWKSSSEGRRHIEQYERRITEATERLKTKYIIDGNGC